MSDMHMFSIEGGDLPLPSLEGPLKHSKPVSVVPRRSWKTKASIAAVLLRKGYEDIDGAAARREVYDVIEALKLSCGLHEEFVHILQAEAISSCVRADSLTKEFPLPEAHHILKIFIQWWLKFGEDFAEVVEEERNALQRMGPAKAALWKKKQYQFDDTLMGRVQQAVNEGKPLRRYVPT